MEGHADERVGFRFDYMSRAREDHQLPVATLKSLALRLTAAGRSRGEPHVPAGYTYLGQFIAHDLSFDRTQAGLGRRLTLARLEQAASPSLDLDSLYGDGPLDEESQHLYVDCHGPAMITGTTAEAGDHPALEDYDLPRGQDGDPRKARIADPRNDDNLAVAQTHAAMLRFHNRVAARLTTAPDPLTRFEQARDSVTRHFQWIVWHDYLPRICDSAVLDEVLAGGRKAFDVGVAASVPPTMPLEFSVGVFRLGHSMIRATYDWNCVATALSIADLFRFSGRSGTLGGHDALPSTRIADFRRLYDFGEVGRCDLRAPVLNRARCVDTRLTDGMRTLPPGTFGRDAVPREPFETNLAFRNLMRARTRQIPSGQDMAAFLHDKGVDVQALTPEEISCDEDGHDARLAGPLGAAGLSHTPLWAYILREAERVTPHNRLTGVGARIVAETFHRAIEASRISIFDGSGWTPTLMHVGKDFSMAHLLLYAFDGDLALLAPLEPPAQG